MSDRAPDDEIEDRLPRWEAVVAAMPRFEQLVEALERRDFDREWDAQQDNAPNGEPFLKKANGKDKGEAEPPPSRALGAGAFMKDYQALSYTLDGILPSGYLYGLTGRQGTGKTAFMITASLAVGTGRKDNTRLRRRARPGGLCLDREPRRLQDEIGGELLRSQYHV